MAINITELKGGAILPFLFLLFFSDINMERLCFLTLICAQLVQSSTSQQTINYTYSNLKPTHKSPLHYAIV